MRYMTQSIKIEFQFDAGQAAVGRRGLGACTLKAFDKQKDVRRLCQSQSMRFRTREGKRARIAQMEADKKGRVLLTRGRKVGGRRGTSVRQERVRRWIQQPVRDCIYPVTDTVPLSPVSVEQTLFCLYCALRLFVVFRL